MAPSGFSLAGCSQSMGFIIFICPVHQKGVALPGTNAPYQLPAFRGIMAVPGGQMENKCILCRRTAQMELCRQPPFEYPMPCSPLDLRAPAASGWTLMLVLSIQRTSVLVSIRPIFWISSKIFWIVPFWDQRLNFM